MRWWRWGTGMVLGAVALFVAGCGLLGPDARLRYRVTVEVDTPQGVRTASSVWQSDAHDGSGIPDTALSVRAKGEAVALDLPGGTLFALMRDQSLGHDYVHSVIGKHLGRHPDPSLNQTGDWRSDARNIQASKLTFNLDADEYPLLVRFRDINEPASVEKVDPFNLSASLGPGVHLRRITIVVTNERVTGGIRKRLHWLSKHPELSLKSNHSADDWSLPARLTHGDFVIN